MAVEVKNPLPTRREIEKSLLESKKFVAYQVAEVTWKILLCILLVMGIREGAIDVFVGAIALAMIIVAGAVEALYLGGQAGLDKYTRIAQIAANAGQSIKMKDIEMSHTPSKPSPAEKESGSSGSVPPPTGE